jgi:hypothetical protein
MHNIKVNTFILLASCLLISCSRKHENMDVSKVVIIPGRGIPGICEIGMSFKELENRNSVVTFTSSDSCCWWNDWRSGRFALAQSLGAVIFFEGKDMPIRQIDFYVSPYNSVTIPGIQITHPFSGRLADDLQFDKGLVARSEVEKHFGKLDLVETNAAYFGQRWRAKKPCCFKRADNVDELWYFDKGVTFIIQSNVVTSFRIYARGIGENKGHP